MDTKKRIKLLLATIILYFTGFFLYKKSGFTSQTTLGIIVIALGCVLMLTAAAINVSFLYRSFKDEFNKKS